MTVLFAIDSFKGSCTSAEACAWAAEGFRRGWPGAETRCLPVADGGEGTVAAFLAACGGRTVEAAVSDPFGRPIPAKAAVLSSGAGVLETAAASGLPLLTTEERDPWRASSYGSGQLLRRLLDEGCVDILVGLGGTATNDGGMGMLAALGARFLDEEGRELGPGGGELLRLHRLDFSGLDPRLSACRFRLLCDVDSPLCGPDGASLTFGPQKGASPETASRLDKALEHFARVVREQLGVDMLPWRGGGAAGGLGAALRLAGNASMTPGIDALLDAAVFEDRLAGCRLVITGEGRMDGQTARGKVPAGVARRAKAAANLPVAALTGGLGPGAHALYACGIDAVFPIPDAPMTLRESMAASRRLLIGGAEQLARLLHASGFA